MSILVFKTNIKTHKMAKRLNPVFKIHTGIAKWSVDIEDIDNVLRIEAKNGLTEDDIIKIVKQQGFNCEDLED